MTPDSRHRLTVPHHARITLTSTNSANPPPDAPDPCADAARILAHYPLCLRSGARAILLLESPGTELYFLEKCFAFGGELAQGLVEVEVAQARTTNLRETFDGGATAIAGRGSGPAVRADDTAYRLARLVAGALGK